MENKFSYKDNQQSEFQINCDYYYEYMIYKNVVSTNSVQKIKTEK